VSIANDRPPDDEILLTDREDLASDIELILSGDPHAPEILARLFLSFWRAIGSGLQGINRTSEALLAAVELTFAHSRAHAAACKLYRLSLEGHLNVEDEPVTLLDAAIGRGIARRNAQSREGREDSDARRGRRVR
jgi:hypothetical protein